MELSIVVPIYNEAQNLNTLIDQLRTAIASLDIDWEIIFVDDGSTDQSWQIVKSLDSDPKIRGIRFLRNFGKEAALRAGLEHSNANAIITIDGDLQHPPELIPKMYQIWREQGVKVVEAVKSPTEQRTPLKQIGAWTVYSVLRRVTGVDLAGGTDFRLIDRSVVEIVTALPERAVFFRGIISWYNFPTAKLSFSVPERQNGTSRWSLLSLIHFGLDAITGFTSAPLRIMTLCSLVFVVFAVVLILQTLYNYAIHNSVEGFTTVILVILVVGAVVTAGLGIIGEYLARIFEEIKARPRYLIRDRSNIE